MTAIVLSISLFTPAVTAAPRNVPMNEQQVSLIAKRVTRNLPANSSVVFSDPKTGEVLFSQNANSKLLPASVMKLFTASVALATFSTEKTFATRSVFDPETKKLYLVGGGDPLLNRTKLAELAKQTAAKLPKGKKIKVVADGTLFPSPRPAKGWVSGYVPGEVNPVTALTVNGRSSLSPNRSTATLFAQQLRALGVKAVEAGTGQASGNDLATVASPPLRTLIKRMLVESDNNIAEHLFRLSTTTTGKSPTWQESSKFAEQTLQSLGIEVGELKIVDGSGLSRNNRITAAALNQLLVIARSNTQPKLNTLLDLHLLPKSGKSGTLRLRFKSDKTKCAIGDVEAKTGSLKDVVTLSGYVKTDTGLAAFTILANHLSRSGVSSVRRDMDWVLAAVAKGC